jgi:hypothetical protein
VLDINDIICPEYYRQTMKHLIVSQMHFYFNPMLFRYEIEDAIHSTLSSSFKVLRSLTLRVIEKILKFHRLHGFSFGVEY